MSALAESNTMTTRPGIHLDTVVEEVLHRAFELSTRQRRPVATYRCQFQQRFGFRDATRLADYWKQLGISDLYASPYLRARRGSTHGYDVVDHSQLNPEVGTDDEHVAFVEGLRAQGMGHILDLVPNHMGVGTDENAWWQDVLENGPSSIYAQFFDIDWQPLKPDIENKVLLPVLGDQFGAVLEEQQFELRFQNGAFLLAYYERTFPIAPSTYAKVLQHRIDELRERFDPDHHSILEYGSILTALSHLPKREEKDPERIAERHREKEVVKRRLKRLCEEDESIAVFIQQNVAIFNGQRGDPSSFDLLDELLQDQAFRLCYWQVAADEINYRRFFDVNELAAVCMELPTVFSRTHEYVLKLLEGGLVDGFRIDHADGLFDPSGYLWQLQHSRFLQLCQQAFDDWLTEEDSTVAMPEWEAIRARIEEVLAHHGLFRDRQGNRGGTQGDDATLEDFIALPDAESVKPPLYVVVEKILEGDETLPSEWPVAGTTGYDFLNQLNGLFVQTEHEKAFSSIYASFCRQPESFDELVYEAKRLIMKVSLAGELHVLGHQLDRLSERHRRSRDYTLHGLIQALREVVACFPVYRTYITASGVSERDRKYIERAVAQAKRRNPAVSHAVFDFVRDVLLLRAFPDASPEVKEQTLRFIGRLQQFTGPLMAKSVEDTAYYNYHRLVSLNEVGGDPRHFGVSVDEFHRFNARRQQLQPFALSATSTHDTKRGEDTRARINVLSELPGSWKEHVLLWARWNKRKKMKVDGELAPSRSDEYLLYQTLIGTWPAEAPTGPALTAYVTRIQQYMLKAMREGKARTSWIAPHEAYERAMSQFIEAILQEQPTSAFRTDFEPFAREIANCGIWNSLSQTLLKLTAPGVPDIYQGTELWDFTLVDPDNRQPVDFDLRQRLLDEVENQLLDDASHQNLVTDLIEHASDGRIKFFLTTQTLQFRRVRSRLFSSGAYVPLQVAGSARDHICAFARILENEVAVVVVPLRTANLNGAATPPCGASVWADTRVVLPDAFEHTELCNVFTGEMLPVQKELSVASLLARFPVGLWYSPPIDHSAFIEGGQTD